MALTPTILGIAESTHYLVGATDENQDFVAHPRLKKVAVCKSLVEAKQILKDNNIESAEITWQTPYDEMCGL